MRRIIIQLSLVLNVVVMFSECNTDTGKIDSIYYSPSNINAIELDDLHDFKIKASFDSPNTREHVHQDFAEANDFKIAYSPIKHLGLYLSANRYKERFTETFNRYELGELFPDVIGVNKVRHQFNTSNKEVGLGFYKKPSDYTFFEIYAFMGIGKGNLISDGKTLSYDIGKSGIRSSLIYQYRKIDFGMSLALTRLKYKNFESNLDANQINRMIDIANNPTQVLVQHATFFKYRFHFLTPSIEIGRNIALDNSFSQNDYYFSTGLTFDIQYIFSDVKKDNARKNRM